jgi:signal transduction histidine kinase
VSRFGDEWKQPFEREMAPTMFVWGESDKVRAPSLPRELRSLPVGMHDLNRGQSTWRVAVTPAMDGRLYVLYDTIGLEKQYRNFSLALLAILLGCSTLAALISGAAARWLINPLNTLTERLTRWVPNFPIADIPQGNESERLMYVFNRVQDQVDAAIADQREFSANLHHEIRTPLTVIQSDAELILGNKVKDPDKVHARLERIVKSVHEINQSLESTFSLAHARFEDIAVVSIRPCVGEIFDSLQPEADKAGLVFVNAVDPAQVETLSQHALMTVLRNIIRNALLHAAPGTLSVESTESGLNFTDSGPGIAPAEQEAVFERYFSNRRMDQRKSEQRDHGAARGMNQPGLGLAIAKRVCVMQSWHLEVMSPVSEGRGTRFSLSFSPNV